MMSVLSILIVLKMYWLPSSLGVWAGLMRRLMHTTLACISCIRVMPSFFIPFFHRITIVRGSWWWSGLWLEDKVEALVKIRKAFMVVYLLSGIFILSLWKVEFCFPLPGRRGGLESGITCLHLAVSVSVPVCLTGQILEISKISLEILEIFKIFLEHFGKIPNCSKKILEFSKIFLEHFGNFQNCLRNFNDVFRNF